MLATCLAKNVTKNIAKRFTKSTKTTSACGAAHIGVDTRMTILVIGRSFLGVGEHFVGLFGLLEFHLGRSVTLVAVGVVFHGQFAIGLLDLVVAGVFGYTQYLVKVAFGGHGGLDLKSANAASTLLGFERGARGYGV